MNISTLDDYTFLTFVCYYNLDTCRFANVLANYAYQKLGKRKVLGNAHFVSLIFNTTPLVDFPFPYLQKKKNRKSASSEKFVFTKIYNYTCEK